MALRNVDKVIADNEVAVKDTLRNFENFYRFAFEQWREDHQHHRDRRRRHQRPSTARWTRPGIFSAGSASDKYGGELLPTVISLRELIESFDKKSGSVITDTRKMLGDLSQSINTSKFGSSPPASPARR